MNALRILVVEDEILVARDLEATLTRLGFEVTGLCGSGEEALESLRRDRPQVVLMDISLGSAMDGVETASRIQSEAFLPVVFLTGHSDEETLARAGTAQPYGYLLKPFHESELRSALELAYARHESLTALKVSGERLTSTLRSMAEGVISTNLLGVIQFMNPVAEAITGWTLREAAGRSLREVFRVALPNGEALEAAMLMMPGAGAAAPRTILLTDRAGRTVPIEDSTTPIRDPGGSLAGIVILFRRREPTPLWKAETGAVEAEGGWPDPLPVLPWPDLSGIVGSISDPLLAVDADWRITWLNTLAAGVLEGAQEALTGQVLWDCLPPSLHRRHYHDFSTALTRREACSFEMEQEARGRWFGVQLYPFEGGLLVLLKDVTQRRRAEEERSKMEKLENLGLLARGFAHDFNNLLTVLLGNLSLAESRILAGGTAADPPAAELHRAMQATVQAQNLVQQLLIFARGGAPIRQLTDAGRLVHEWFAEWPGRADVEYRLAASPDTWQVEWDRHQIRRVLANLVKNAEQAITGDAGRITITLKPAPRSPEPGKEDKGEGRGCSEGEGSGPEGAFSGDAWLVLEVADNGAGMEEKVISQVREPYFTTRGDSNASGLGLTVCESITRAHGGGLRILSRPDEGTRVRAVFPLPAGGACVVEAGRTPPPPRPTPAVAPAARVPDPQKDRPRALILEDEPLICQLLQRQLEGMGFEVTVSVEGSETVSFYAESLTDGRPYDLLITDLSIPGGMGGAQAMDKIRRMDPGVLAIVSSGYSDDPVMSRHTDYGFRGVLPKPYQPRELRELIERLLPGSRRRERD